jgi:hypothetical protein
MTTHLLQSHSHNAYEPDSAKKGSGHNARATGGPGILPATGLPFLPLLTLYLTFLSGPAAEPVFPADPTAWPAVTATTKPWTRWWWLGSGVDRANLTRELEGFAKAGLGGVEICPIYEAVGAESKSLEFLSPPWLAMLAHTTTEAKRLGLGVDLTTGTGWPFGGPMVTPDMASNGLRRITQTATGGKKLTLKLPKGNLQCLRAFPASGAAVDLTDSVKAGVLDWTPPAGTWTICGLTSQAPMQQVKRAAPGGAGNVLDPYSTAACQKYLATFDRAFENFKAPRPRAQFHDSFEYYGADWTPGLFEAFKAARGYDLRDQLAAFNGTGAADSVARVRADYRETLSELHRDYLKTWHDWAQQHGGITRNQAHGSPGNLLDHYAVADIPKTEIFRLVGEDQIPMLRFAAAAAHANGNPLVSSESFTWLGEHFQVTPEQLKEAADFVFLGGVNHLFFHGIPYSPADAPWPGWLFYASTHMGPNGGLWRDLPAFTGYLQRCQSILQQGTPSSEVLLYFPFEDLIHDGAEKLPLFTIHNQGTWLHPTPFYRTAMELWNHGITFDYTSDALLSRATVRDGEIQLGNNSFKALVLPGVKHLATGTLEKLLDLAKLGATIIIQDGWSTEVPGFYQHEQRRANLLALQAGVKSGVVQCTGSVLPALTTRGVLQERMTEAGLRIVRRRHAEGFHYFIVNRGEQPFAGPVPLAVAFKSAVLLDPWNAQGPRVVASDPPTLRLAPDESILIRTFANKFIVGQPYLPPAAGAQTIPLPGPWKLEFTEGGPVLPQAAELRELTSWTKLPDPAVLNFSGTAKYATAFDRPAGPTVRLDLGKVCHTARVYLNGNLAGISWCAPRVIDLSPHLQPGRNHLVIEVTNLAANRIADLDRRKVPWKRFHEINFVNIDYKDFDASAWPALDSGLLGPVSLRIEQEPAAGQRTTGRVSN